jgi:PAS domain S-box-containing protein
MKGAVRHQGREGRARRRNVPTTDFSAVFHAVPDPCLLLDRNLAIVAVNDAYLKATMTLRERIVGRRLFDVFPANPDDPVGSGVRNLGESLSRVISTGVLETMPVQKYDIPAQEGGFLERYWSPVNSPVFGADGQVAYVIHRVQDVTEYMRRREHRQENEPAAVWRERADRMEGEIYAMSRQVAEAQEEMERTMAALREKQNLFEAFMDHLPAAAWMKDMEGRYVFANAETGRLFSTSVDSLLGKTSEQVFPPEIASQFFDIDRRVLDDGGNAAPIEVVRQSEGGERHLLVSKFVIRDPQGSPEFIAGVALDATETRLLEEEVERLATFPLVNPNPVLEFDLEGKVSFCNPAAKAVLLNSGRCAGGNPFIPENLPAIIRDLLAEKITAYSGEVEVGGRWFETQVTLLAQQKTVRCYTMDITRRKRAEREREQVLLQMQAILENINEGVVISDLQGNVLTMNKEALALHGFESVEQVRRHVTKFQDLAELATLDGEVLDLDNWPLVRALRGERFFDYELRLHLKETGNRLIASYNGTPIRNREGEAILAVITLRDVTRRRELEEQILSLNHDLEARVAELEQANEELEAFNRMVSHDLRQPLNLISTSCQAVQMLCNLGDDCKKYVDVAYHKVLFMNELIESLLKFSRTAHTELRRERVDLTEVARSVFTDIRVAEPARRVTFKAAEGVIADGDPRLLRSVLENLIGNAWKYTADREEAVIEFGVVRKGERESFFVRDNGRGFDPKQVEQLFTPFKRLPGAEQYRGFGIGLATVDRIVRRHGGEVCADAEPGKSATFYFTLPPAAPDESGTGGAP